jgi:hypothetical protein
LLDLRIIHPNVGTHLRVLITEEEAYPHKETALWANFPNQIPRRPLRGPDKGPLRGPMQRNCQRSAAGANISQIPSNNAPV